MKSRKTPIASRSSVRARHAGTTLPVQLELFAGADATYERNLGTPNPHAAGVETGGAS